MRVASRPRLPPWSDQCTEILLALCAGGHTDEEIRRRDRTANGPAVPPEPGAAGAAGPDAWGVLASVRTTSRAERFEREVAPRCEPRYIGQERFYLRRDLDRWMEALPPPEKKPGTLGALFTLYRASPEFTQLKPASKLGYQRAMDALKSQHHKPLFDIDQPYILELRDEVFDARGRCSPTWS